MGTTAVVNSGHKPQGGVGFKHLALLGGIEGGGADVALARGDLPPQQQEGRSGVGKTTRRSWQPTPTPTLAHCATAERDCSVAPRATGSCHSGRLTHRMLGVGGEASQGVLVRQGGLDHDVLLGVGIAQQYNSHVRQKGINRPPKPAQATGAAHTRSATTLTSARSYIARVPVDGEGDGGGGGQLQAHHDALDLLEVATHAAYTTARTRTHVAYTDGLNTHQRQIQADGAHTTRSPAQEHAGTTCGPPTYAGG
jgi:hypothetical protein